jgi:hypothetical protein
VYPQVAGKVLSVSEGTNFSSVERKPLHLLLTAALHLDTRTHLPLMAFILKFLTTGKQTGLARALRGMAILQTNNKL